MKNQLRQGFLQFERNQRNKFSKNEIFSSVHSIFQQARFSPKLKYFGVKSRLQYNFFSTIKNRCILTNNSRSVYTHLRISKLQFSYCISKGLLPGFYRSV